jgi:hypothetical protein
MKQALLIGLLQSLDVDFVHLQHRPHDPACHDTPNLSVSQPQLVALAPRVESLGVLEDRGIEGDRLFGAVVVGQERGDLLHSSSYGLGFDATICSSRS